MAVRNTLITIALLLFVAPRAFADVYGRPGVPVLNADRTVKFNLYALPIVEPPDIGERAGHRRKAAYKAPFWAAEIRKSIDRVLEDSYSD